MRPTRPIVTGAFCSPLASPPARRHNRKRRPSPRRAPRNSAAREALLRMVSPKFYRSLLISPVEGWIVVRGDLVNNHLRGTKVIHSESGGGYDALATELANNLQVLDYTSAQTATRSRAILVH